MIVGSPRPIHLVGIVLAATLLYRSVWLVRKNKESVSEFLLWFSLGFALLVLSLGDILTLTEVYNAVSGMLGLFGFGSGFTGLLVMSNIVLLAMLLFLFVKVQENKKRIYDLNQEIALMEVEEQTED